MAPPLHLLINPMNSQRLEGNCRVPENTREDSPALSLGAGAKAACLVLLMGLIYANTLAGLARAWWTDDRASAGLVVLPLSLYVAWLLRKRILAIPIREDGRGILLIGLGCGLFWLGLLGSDLFVSRVSFVVVVAGLVWAFWGLERLGVMAFPFVLFLTSIPLPQLLYARLAMPLQLFASLAATSMLQTVGISVYRDGNIIQLPGLVLGVEEACSGLSSLTCLVVTALMIGFLYCRRPASKVILVLVSIPLAIGFNLLRITMTAVLALYRQDLALGFYHSFTGWLVFVLSFGLLLLLGRLLEKGLESSS